MKTGLTALAFALVFAAAAQAQDYAIFSPQDGAALSSAPASPAGATAIAGAEAALGRTPGPLPVVHTEGTLPGQGIRDASLVARRDLPAMLDLALAWRLTGERKYLEAADRFMLAWAQTYIVSLNPIDETNFDAMILAYDLTEPDLPAGTRAAMDGFLRDLATGYLDEMDGAPKHFYTNWQSHRIKIAALASFQLGDARLIERTFEDYQKHVATNVLAEGTVFDFYERDAIHYVLYNVDPMMMAGLAARAHGLDWFGWRNASGAGVSSVIDWLTPYVEGAKTHQEFVRSRIAFDAERRAAGQTEYAGPWRPERAVNTLALASLLDESRSPRLEALLAVTDRRPPAWMTLYRAARGVRGDAPQPGPPAAHRASVAHGGQANFRSGLTNSDNAVRFPPAVDRERRGVGNMIRQRALLLGAVSAFALGGSLAIAGDAVAQAAGAGQAAETPAQDANDRLDEVVVTGFRGAYASALATKRNSDQITDSISSDGLGRFPDLNVGEAIQRLPGVQINREADSRNATISLRGLPGSFARTTLNGSGFADPILSTSTNMGSTPLGAFNSDIFSGITIIKSPDASNVAGGLSGIIDLRIAPALSRRDGGFVKAAYEYNDLGSQGSPSYTVGYNTHLGEDFAVFGTLAFKEENFRRDSITVNSWANRLGSIQVGNQGVPGSNPVYDALIAANPGGVYYPSQMRQFVRQNRGDVFTGAAGFEWQVTDQVRFGLTGFYTRRQLDEGTNHLLYIENGAGQNTNTALTATSAVTRFTSLGTPYVAADGRAYINEFSSVNAQTFDSVRSEPVTQRVWAINPTVTFENDEWRATLEGTISRAEARSDQIELDIVQNANRNLGPAGLNGITSSVFTGGDDLSRFRINLFTPNASHIPAGGYTIPVAANSVTQVGAVMPGQAATVAGDRFGVTGTNGQALTDLDAVQFDLERTLTGSFLSSLTGGLRFESASFESSGSRNSAMGINLAGLTQSVSEANPYIDDFFGGEAGGYTSAWRSVNVRQVLAAITPVNTALRTTANPNGLTNQFLLDPATGVFLTTYGLVNNYWDPNYWNNNFTNSNDTFSAYAMARFDTEVFGFRAQGNVGLRYETLDTSIVALDCQGCSSVRSTAGGAVNHRVTERSYDSENDYWLPSAMAKIDLTDQLVLRAAYYRTYVRPQPRDNVPVTSVLTPDPAVVNSPYTITIGATNLSPYTSDAYDLALEWYNRPGGVFAVSLYQKDVDGYIGPIVDPTLLCPSSGLINGVDFGLGPLTISGTNCLTAGGVQVQASGSTNQDPITVRGAELAVQQNLDFLPGWLSHFGGAANFTYIDIEGTTGAGIPITLPSVSRKNLNLIGYYETDRFGIRLTWNWRGDYDLAAGNSFVGDARTVKSRSQLDASASYNVTDRITLSADAFNLTDATRSEYQSDPMLPRRIDYDGRTYQLTLRATF